MSPATPPPAEPGPPSSSQQPAGDSVCKTHDDWRVKTRWEEEHFLRRWRESEAEPAHPDPSSAVGAQLRKKPGPGLKMHISLSSAQKGARIQGLVAQQTTSEWG